MSGYYPDGCSQGDFDRAFDELGPKPDPREIEELKKLEQFVKPGDEILEDDTCPF